MGIEIKVFTPGNRNEHLSFIEGLREPARTEVMSMLNQGMSIRYVNTTRDNVVAPSVTCYSSGK